jgi:hypothetical protein
MVGGNGSQSSACTASGSSDQGTNTPGGTNTTGGTETTVWTSESISRVPISFDFLDERGNIIVPRDNSGLSATAAETDLDELYKLCDDKDMPKEWSQRMWILWCAFYGTNQAQILSHLSTNGSSSYTCPVCSQKLTYRSIFLVITSVLALPPEKPAEDLPRFRDMHIGTSICGSTSAMLSAVPAPMSVVSGHVLVSTDSIAVSPFFFHFPFPRTYWRT